MTIKEFAEKLKEIIKLIDIDIEIRNKRPIPLVTESLNLKLNEVKGWIDELLHQAEQERTNFEKWKDELTVQQLADCADANCDICPLKHSEKCPDPNWDYDCREIITEWANERCEE